MYIDVPSQLQFLGLRKISEIVGGKIKGCKDNPLARSHEFFRGFADVGDVSIETLRCAVLIGETVTAIMAGKKVSLMAAITLNVDN